MAICTECGTVHGDLTNTSALAWCPDCDEANPGFVPGEAAEERALAGPEWTYGELCRIDYEGPGAFCQCARCTAEAHAKEELYDQMEMNRAQREPSAAELEAERARAADEDQLLALCHAMLEGFFYR